VSGVGIRLPGFLVEGIDLPGEDGLGAGETGAVGASSADGFDAAYRAGGFSFFDSSLHEIFPIVFVGGDFGVQVGCR
jgi:hypothetical protein